MKSTGIVRRIDDLGRVVLPKEIRRTLDTEEGDALEIFTHGNMIVLRRYFPGCVFCGDVEHLVQHKGHRICQRCIDVLSRPGAVISGEE